MKMRSASIIIENSKGQILLQLRDNKPDIQYPNQWVILGGNIEADESPEEAIKREIKEEIEIELPEPKSLKVYEWPEKTDYLFYAKLDLDVRKIKLHEGQMIRYFSPLKLKKMKLGFRDNAALNDFLQNK